MPIVSVWTELWRHLDRIQQIRMYTLYSVEGAWELVVWYWSKGKGL